MPDFTKKQLEAIAAALAIDKGIDLVTGGRLNKMSKKILIKTIRTLVPPVARFGGRAGISVAGTALGMGRLALMNPYVLGGTAIYVGYQERDKIKSLLEQGYEIVEERLPPAPTIPTMPGIPTVLPPSMIPSMPISSVIRPPRRKSAFNKAVGAGMKAVKKSTSYGGIGKIKPATKVFSLVTKLASAKKKKKKAPKKGIRRKIWAAMGRYL